MKTPHPHSQTTDYPYVVPPVIAVCSAVEKLPSAI